MKKIIGFFIALALVIALSACGNNYKVTIENAVEGRSTYTCNVKIEEDDSMTKGSVIIKINEITDDGDSLFTTKTLSSFEGPVSVTGLNSSTDYRADLYCTINKKQELIYSWSFKTNEDGTQYDPISITTASQLVDAISEDYSSDAYYILGCDIDFSTYVDEETKEPKKFEGLCKSSSQSFQGNFDGDGFTIKNVTITSTSGYVGFFGYLKGIVRNVNFENVTINVDKTSTESTYIGALCGYGYEAKINNVNINGCKLNVSAPKQYVGGLVGYSFATNILNSNVSNLDITSKKASTGYVGGLTGYLCQNSSNLYGLVYYSKVDGKINVSNASDIYYGGLVGYAKSGISIEEAIADVEANILADGKIYAGGFAGCVNFGSGENTKSDAIRNVVAKGELKYQTNKNDERAESSNNILIGGFIGSATSVDVSCAYIDILVDIDCKLSKDGKLYASAVYGCGYDYHTTLRESILNAKINVVTTDSNEDSVKNIHGYDGESYKDANGNWCSVSGTQPIYISLGITIDGADESYPASTASFDQATVDLAKWNLNIWDVEIKTDEFVISFK